MRRVLLRSPAFARDLRAWLKSRPGGAEFIEATLEQLSANSKNEFCRILHSQTGDEMERKRFEIKRVRGMPVTDEELLADVRAVAISLGKNTVGQKGYRRLGKYDDTTVSNRFGTWNNALRTAGLNVSNQVDLSDDRLFENILALWTHYGPQPRRSELAQAPSVVSQSPYVRRFGSWGAALEAFVEFANATDADLPPDAVHSTTGMKRTPRDPSLRLRFRVLQRDRFACQSCGASPAITAGVELHVDHVIPWSKGGETTFENLRMLCRLCNLGKGALVEGAA
jgi:hypothetical protein